MTAFGSLPLVPKGR